MIDASKENPAPLDAYVTAEPDEPTFTLQGGDPLAPPLVRFWVQLARLRATNSAAAPDLGPTNDCYLAAINNSLKDNAREVENILVRATAAEEVSWAMDSYLKGTPGADLPSSAGENFLDEKAKLDRHDLRVRAAGQISNMFSTLNEIGETFAILNYTYEEGHAESLLAELVQGLRRLHNIIEPRPGHRVKSNLG